MAKSEPKNAGVLGDDELSGREREENDEELRQVPERRLQDAGQRRAEPLTDRLRRERDDPGDAREREGGDEEHRYVGGTAVLKRRRRRDDRPDEAEQQALARC